MAHLTPNGKISGKCGDIVYRNVGGKTVICSRPGPQKKSTDPNVIARRNRFKLAAKLSSALGRIPVMKCIWNQFGIKKDTSAYSKMLKDFHSLIGIGDIPETFRMGPALANMSVEPAEFKQENDKLTAEIQIENNNSGLENLESVQMVVLMFLKDPLDYNMLEYSIIALASEETKYAANEKMKFDVALVGDVEDYIKMYDARKFFCLFSGFDENHKLVGYSNTLCKKFS